MRKILFAIGLGLAVTAGAQQYAVRTLMGGYATNVVAAGGVSNYSAGEFVLDCTKYQDVAIQIRFRANDTTTGASSNATFNFAWGPNATTIAATKQFALTIPVSTPTVTAYVQCTTNVTVGAAGYLMLHSINAVHVDGDAITNITIKVATKPRNNG